METGTQWGLHPWEGTGRGFRLLIPSTSTSTFNPTMFHRFETFKYLHTCVEVAQHVSSYPKELLFELYPVSDEEFESLLSKLPCRFGSMIASYVNRELVTEMAAPRV